MSNRLTRPALLAAYTLIAASASYALIPHQSFERYRAAEQERLMHRKLNQYPSLHLNQVSEDIEHTVQRGESLSSIFSELSLAQSDLREITQTSALGKQFTEVEPGQNLAATVDAQGQLAQLSYSKNPFETLVATRNEQGFDVKVFSKKVDYQITTATATINSSLFEDGVQAGMPEKIILKLADIFAWDIDFAQNLHEGDQMTVVYETLLVDGQPFDSGDILSAHFVNQGETHAAVRFVDNQGHTGYYSPDGQALRKAFLQNPMDFVRISSTFNLHRKHPILNKIRAHKGVDYAAAIGTPVKTTGDGKIVFRGKKAGYGNVVEIQHGQQYSTLYAHLSSFKNKQKLGSEVKQGEIIGYVGKTGLATGPHLHYEFRIAGQHVNPLSAKLPHNVPLDEHLMAQFKTQTQPLLAQLQQARTVAQR